MAQWEVGLRNTGKALLSRREKAIFGLLFIGYICYYLTRKNITVASLSMKELGLLTLAQIGYLSSVGTLFYAIGKFTNGFLADFLGGKRTFLLGMYGSVTATVLFGLSTSYSLFLIFWALNSYFLSMGWSGIIKVSSYWFGGSRRGRVLGWMALNYQMGSSISKAFTSFLMGFSIFIWRGLFFVPALILFLMAIVILVFLRERPERAADGARQTDTGPAADGARQTDTGPAADGDKAAKGEPEADGDKAAKGEPEADGGSATEGKAPMNGVMSPGQDPRPGPASSLPPKRPMAWIALFRSPAFLLILWGSAAMTLIRTFFDDFTAIWLSSGGMEKTTAGYIAALFTVGGMVGTIVVGYVSDLVHRGNRTPTMVFSCLLLGALLFTSTLFPKDSVFFATLFFLLAGMFIYGVYSVIAGVTAIDFGGSTAPATAAGIIDGVGYLAAALAGVLVAQMKSYAAWERVVFFFAALTILIAITLLPLWKRYPAKSVA
jgi:sugar phosphate permease